MGSAKKSLNKIALVLLSYLLYNLVPTHQWTPNCHKYWIKHRKDGVNGPIH
jgi:hypothetical protein